MRWALAWFSLACACTTTAALSPDDLGRGSDLSASLALDAAIPPVDLGPIGAPAIDFAVEDLRAPRIGPVTVTMRLDAGAFPPTPLHPSALVYIPRDFDPTPPIHVVVYIHGHSNCVENVVKDAGGSCNADAGTPVRTSFALVSQFENAGKNAILVLPEVRFDQASGDPGTLANTNGFRALLAEVLANLTPLLGARTVGDVGRMLVASHSGGYLAADGITNKGGIAVQEVFLLDSLYNYATVAVNFENWAKLDLGSFYPQERRFADVYTAGDGTLTNSQLMAADVKALFPGDAGVILDDRVAANTWADADYHHGFLFKYSMLSHNGVAQYYFQRLVATSKLPDK